MSRPAAAASGILNGNLRRRRGRKPQEGHDATHFDISLTAPCNTGPRQVRLEMSTGERFGDLEIRSESAGGDRTNGRCFWPYIQDPPSCSA